MYWSDKDLADFLSSGMTPDGSPLLVRDISTQEIYAIDWKLP